MATSIVSDKKLVAPRAGPKPKARVTAAKRADAAQQRDGALGEGRSARESVAVFAAGEIEALIKLVRREWARNEVEPDSRDIWTFGTLLNGWLARLEQLNSVVISVVGDDPGRSVEEMDRVVFGRGT